MLHSASILEFLQYVCKTSICWSHRAQYSNTTMGLWHQLLVDHLKSLKPKDIIFLPWQTEALLWMLISPFEKKKNPKWENSLSDWLNNRSIFSPVHTLHKHYMQVALPIGTNYVRWCESLPTVWRSVLENEKSTSLLLLCVTADPCAFGRLVQLDPTVRSEEGHQLVIFLI